MTRYTARIKLKNGTVYQWIWAYTAYQARVHANALARSMFGKVISVVED